MNDLNRASELTVSQSRSLISAALHDNEEAIVMILNDIKETGDIEGVALHLTGMIVEWFHYFSDAPSEEWSDLLLAQARLEGDEDA